MVTAEVERPEDTARRHAAFNSPGGLAWYDQKNLLPPHLKLLNEEIVKLVDAIVTGEGEYADKKGLIVSMPPQNGKSELCSHYTPPWALGRYPWMKIILASYEASFAASWGEKAREVIREYGEDLFGVRVYPKQDTRSYWEVEDITGRERRRGYMATAGVGGAITGKGADLFVIDDPVKNAAEASSEVYRQAAKDWWKSTARTRLQPNGKVLLVQTRWNEDDLAGHFKEQMEKGGDQWVLLTLPAIAEEDDALGRTVGEALWPERFSLKFLEETRIEQGPFWFGAMYQQSPSASGGGIFNGAWWKWYSQLPPLNYNHQGWDTANKTAEINDYSAVVTIGEREGRYYVTDVMRRRWEYPDLVKMIGTKYREYRPSRVVIEDAASGTQAIQSLKRQSGIPIVGVTPDKDKVNRARAVTGYIEAGLVYLPEDAPWLGDFLRELAVFPNGAYDDMVDAFVHCLYSIVTQAQAGRSENIDTLGYGERPPRDSVGLDLRDDRYRDRDIHPSQ